MIRAITYEVCLASSVDTWAHLAVVSCSMPSSLLGRTEISLGCRRRM
jgi:hypothetical protein